MNRHLIHTALIVLASAASAHAFAGQELMAVDSNFRAKIAKEKIRMAAQQREADQQGQSTDNQSSSCGSQSIGNVNTNGRIGAAPREVFVFAPNAINIVGRGGCN